MRRVVAAAALVVAVVATTPTADAQDSGYNGRWIDPVPSATRDDKPLGYLDGDRPLAGEVSHPNGIRAVNAVLVPDADNPPPDGCAGEVDPNAELSPDGSFKVHGTFPCNIVYEIRATAQANAGSGLGSSTPGPYSMPLLVAVAVPPAPVSQVDAALEVDGDDHAVTLTWPRGAEPDLLGYVVARTTDGDTEQLGQVDATDDAPRFVDDDPPTGYTSTYSVTAVRTGPDDDVEQVPAAPTTVDVDVPGERASDGGSNGGSSGSGKGTSGSGDPVDPELAGAQVQAGEQGRPDAGSLSSVRRRASTGRPTPPTTADTGFSETIDYGEPGEEAAVLPGGDPSVVALYDESVTGSPWSNKETMSFVAGGLAVLMGAAVVLTVTRRAARAAY
jgi:hypothetical protein